MSMKLIVRPFVLSVFLILMAPIVCLGQAEADVPTDSSNVKLLNVAKEIMHASITCTLITVDQEGRPRARLMDPFLPDEDMTFWFGTNAKSRKVKQIQHNPKCTIFYTSEDHSGYVMIHGDAELVKDAEMEEKYWKEEWQAFYPDKDESYLLIKVSPAWLEVVSYKHGITGDPVTWEAESLIFDQK